MDGAFVNGIEQTIRFTLTVDAANGHTERVFVVYGSDLVLVSNAERQIIHRRLEFLELVCNESCGHQEPSKESREGSKLLVPRKNGSDPLDADNSVWCIRGSSASAI